MTLTDRQYVPEVGKLVKLREWIDYTSRGITPWAWFKVLEVNGESATIRHSNAGELLETIIVPLTSIKAPIGWEPRYTIYCQFQQAHLIVSDWFKRGIIVRANHCIGDSAGSTFQPMDNAPQPTWKHVEVTDSIPASECARVFRVVAVQKQEVNHYVDPTLPNLRVMGRSKRAVAIKAMRADGWEVNYCAYAGGFWERRKETIVHDWTEV